MNKLKILIASAALLFCAAATTVITSFPSPLAVSNGGTGLASGTNLSPAYVAGNYYLALLPNGLWTNSAFTNPGTFYCVTASFFSTVHVDKLILTINGGATGNVQAALYNVGSWGKPSTPIVNTTSMSTGSTGDVSQTVTSTSVPAGPIAVCIQADNGSFTFKAWDGNGGTPWPAMSWGSAAQSDVTGNQISFPASGFSTTGSYTSGSWPTWSSGTTWTAITSSLSPVLAFHVASVP